MASLLLIAVGLVVGTGFIAGCEHETISPPTTTAPPPTYNNYQPNVVDYSDDPELADILNQAHNTGDIGWNTVCA